MPFMSDYRVSAALWAGLIAGVIYLVVEMALVLAVGGNAWFALRALFLGRSPSPTFSVGIAVFALFFHFIRAFASAFVLTVITHRMALRIAIPVGAIVGAVFYACILAFYGSTGRYSQSPMPDNASRSIAILFTTYVVFGMACAVVYNLIMRPRPS